MECNRIIPVHIHDPSPILRDDIDACLTLFLNDTPLMDVRAPVEFRQGAFPNTVNLPLLDDEQREAIGIRYKEAGQDAAIELGHERVSGRLRAERLDAWVRFAREHPEGYLYCFRGGLRSNTVQQWLAEAGIHYPLIRGGYKALRRVLIDELARRVQDRPIRVIAGPTGSGKTDVIHRWPLSLDLEGRARHRGSAFGRTFEPQPSQIDWENQIAIDWLKADPHDDHTLLVEDESRLIGRINVFPELLDKLQNAPIVALEAPLDERIERIRRDYFEYTLHHHRQHSPDDPWTPLADYTKTSLHRIRKRLGGVRYQSLLSETDAAVEAVRADEDWRGFDGIIRVLLTDYYDPMYAYQMTSRDDRVVFRGDADAIIDWLSRHPS